MAKRVVGLFLFLCKIAVEKFWSGVDLVLRDLESMMLKYLDVRMVRESEIGTSFRGEVIVTAAVLSQRDHSSWICSKWTDNKYKFCRTETIRPAKGETV